jgi:MFS family permease
VSYYRFFLSNKRIVLFLILFTFFSGLGQTFVLSVYIPDFLKNLDIHRTYFSTIYSLATVISGISIIFAGRFIDHIPVRTFSFVVIAGLVIANLFAGFAHNVFTLFLAIFMLRFFGQGLSTHTAFTVAGKYFNKTRGKALGLAYLGFPLSESLMPNLALMAILALGWRYSFFLSAAAVVLFMLPLTVYFLKYFNRDEKNVIKKNDETVQIQNDSHILNNVRKEVFQHRIFFFIAPTPFLAGFILTVLFFYQTFLAESKGWSIEWMAFNIIFYALASFIFSFLGGPLVDKYSARKLFPIITLPFIAGLLILFFFQHPVTASVYWFLIGTTAGLHSTVINALYAEVYGVSKLGSIRSFYSFIMIAGTAAGPVAYSLIMDAGFGLQKINLLFAIVLMLHLVYLLLWFPRKIKMLPVDNTIA